MVDPSGHVDPYQLMLLHQGELEEANATVVRAHLESCASCRAELALAADFDETSAEPVDDATTHRLREWVSPTGSGVPRATRRATAAAPSPSRWQGSALVAAGIAVAALGLWQLAPMLQDSGELGPSGQVRAIGDERWIVEVHSLPKGREVRWPPAGSGSGVPVEVRVHDATGRILHTVEAMAPPVLLTHETLRNLHEEHGPLFVSLSTRLADGQDVRSGVRSLSDDPAP